MAEILNANPTIRNATDLPSRRRHNSIKSGDKPLGLFASTIPAAAYLPDPFSPTEVPELSDGNSESDPEGDAIEPIDEQEIYGKHAFDYRLYQLILWSIVP